MTLKPQMKGRQSAINDERRTVELMIRLYCRHKHGNSELCRDCRHLFNYANQRLTHCPFAEHKHTCRRCSVHCYGKAERERIREVMRFAGSRMLFCHPIMVLKHIIKESCG